MWVITWGSRGHNHPPAGPDPLGEDGSGEPDADGEAQAPIQNLAQLNPSNEFPLKPRQQQQGRVLKQTSDDEGNDQGDYAWNWHKPRGGPPWWDLDEGTLSTARKTHLLQNTYLTNTKLLTLPPNPPVRCPHKLTN